MVKNTEEKLWSNISIGDTFLDGSKVTSIHDSYEAECYDVSFKSKGIFGKVHHCILSDTHLLLCDVSKMEMEARNWVKDNFSDWRIPTLYDKHVYCKDLGKILNGEPITKSEIINCIENYSEETYQVIESDLSKVSENEYWLPISAIFLLVRSFNQTVLCNGNKIYIDYVGVREVFCVNTDTHKFETCGLIHHNSVTLRNIIFHCLTHGEQICIALIDLKYTEFTPFKGVKNVVAVANTVREAAEIMRLGREVMYKRNQELAKLGLNDIKNFKPTKPTNEVIVAGRKLKDTDTLEIKINGEIKTVTVKELEEYL